MGSLPIKGVREGHGPASCDHYVTKPNSREAYSASFGASTKRPMALTSGLRVRFRIPVVRRRLPNSKPPDPECAARAKIGPEHAATPPGRKSNRLTIRQCQDLG